MPYVVINRSNAFDPIKDIEHATEEAADAAARALLEAQPTASLFTAKVVKGYSAEVTVSAESVEAEV